MLSRKWRNGAWLAVGVLVLSASVGCCCRTRKGIVLRGDWSLELNRVPHMQSNGPTYSGDCSAPIPCSVPCGCADGGAGAGNYEVLDGSGYPGGAGGTGGGGRGGAGGFGGGEGGLPMPMPPTPTPAAQSRFHPIPTRPAFEPQALAWEGEPIDAGAAPQAPAPTTRRNPARLAARPSGQATRSAPIRRTSAEVEAYAPEEAAAEPGYEPAAETVAHEAPVAPSPPELPETTSTWRVKTRRS